MSIKLSNREAVLATIAYADVFNFSLASKELFQWLIKNDNVVTFRLHKNLRTIKINGETFVYLRGRKQTVFLRQKRQFAARYKWKLAYKYCRWFRLVPTVRLIGVTGALAMNNTYDNDDIDLFIVAYKHSLWVTRFFLIVLAELMGIRRRPSDKFIKNKFCFNMFMSESALAILPKEQDLYMAHEVLQMVPLWYTGNIYSKFLQINSWAKKYLPNAWKQNYLNQTRNTNVSSALWFRNILSRFLSFFESVMRIIQLWYMQKRRTREVITRTNLRFHPKDARIWVKRRLQKKLRNFGIPIDKIFYAS